MNDLIDNLSKIHTTKMGAERIIRNLELKNNDAVDWCKEKIGQSGDITRKGKNWYVNTDGAIITVNAHSYTVITAHKKKECK
jgi:hypothetical protein